MQSEGLQKTDLPHTIPFRFLSDSSASQSCPRSTATPSAKSPSGKPCWVLQEESNHYMTYHFIHLFKVRTPFNDDGHSLKLNLSLPNYRYQILTLACNILVLLIVPLQKDFSAVFNENSNVLRKPFLEISNIFI